jgi:hypothetical protein
LDIQVLSVRKKGTFFSPDNPEIVAPIFEADEILLGPGSPTYCARQLTDSLALQIIKARHRLGGTLFLSSSAVLAFSAQTMPIYEIYKVGEDLHWKPGLDFPGMYGLPLVVIPHWNNTDGGSELDTSRCYLGQDRFQRLCTMLDPAYQIVGIDEHTSLVIDFSDECCRVMGKGQVTLLDPHGKRVFDTGQAFPLSELGEWSIPEGRGGISEEVWQKAVQVQREREAAQAAEAAASKSPSPEAVDLMEQRAAAREAQDWTSADALRDQLQEMGWQVMDTPDGPVLTKLD